MFVVDDFNQMRTVKYIRENYLLQESAHAHSEDNYYEYSNKIAGYDLLVIDDFGLMDLNLDKCRDLFEIIEARLPKINSHHLADASSELVPIVW